MRLFHICLVIMFLIFEKFYFNNDYFNILLVSCSFICSGIQIIHFNKYFLCAWSWALSHQTWVLRI